jgi:DNA-binding MarR family transcriptional regulator
MISRKQKVEQFLTDLRSFRRAMSFRMAGSANIPRITPSQWGVLMSIEDRGESTVKDIAKTLGITSSATTQLIDGLVANGYVMRTMHPEDRRAVTLSLSKKTKTQVAQMKKQTVQKFIKLFKVLTDDELNRYFALNKKIVQGFL